VVNINESCEAKPHSWPFSLRDEWSRRDASDIDGPRGRMELLGKAI
jgi:hypothetical protein